MTYFALIVAFAALPVACRSAVAVGPARWTGSLAALTLTGTAMMMLAAQ